MSDFEDFEPYVSFNSDKIDKKNNRLFIFPPGESGAESYFNNIVPQLKDYNLILFNNYYHYLYKKFDHEFMNHVTFEKLATEHITYIKSIQATGPYHLFGWSFGGTLALEIARQLTDKDEKVSNLILLDTCFDCKETISRTDFHKTYPIYSNYFPHLENKQNINIVLFKALHFRFKPSDPEFLVYKYYAEETQSNHLDLIIKDKDFKVVDMNHDHFSWVYDKSQIIEICNSFVE